MVLQVESRKAAVVMSDSFDSVEVAIAAVKRGEVVIVVDAEERENEGDFVCAAAKTTSDVINLMVTYGRGQTCVPILPELADRLRLRLMVDENTAPLRTAFTVSVDHKSCRTGISAFERAQTVRSMVDPATRPEDLVRPGHMHPLIAKAGGVLRRAGHTEAVVDLVRLAGFDPPAGVLCEILSDTGRMANRSELFDLARRFQLKIIAIEDLIRYRRSTERLVSRQLTDPTVIETRRGRLKVIPYKVEYEDQQPMAIICGDPEKSSAPLVRMHSSCFTGDLLDSLRCDCGDQLHMALDRIEQEGCGVLVYLPQEGRGIGLVEKLRAYQLQDKGLDTVEANLALGFRADMRDYGQVVDQVPIVAAPTPHNVHYLTAKRDKLGHHLPSDLNRAESRAESSVETKAESSVEPRADQAVRLDGGNRSHRGDGR
jgi:3,4-dihydroxy 2-butanone 4-phosphate synthase/GTP cyclohydrolase II